MHQYHRYQYGHTCQGSIGARFAHGVEDSATLSTGKSSSTIQSIHAVCIIYVCVCVSAFCCLAPIS